LIRHRVTGFTGHHHGARTPVGRVTRVGALVGAGAVLVGVGVGTTMLVGAPGPAPSTGPTAEQITVSATIPLSGSQIAELTHERPDYGPLGDPQRRASCLDGLGYPASAPLLGARPIQLAGQPAVLLVLAGDGAGELVALAVPANCSAADTGLIANTRIAPMPG
jgi:hypothetical protein